ncbi:MAG: hypothetical protein E7465_03535 [Ruminococcaceae bacterium]|nr:hypothetical protein [Oscillospiraceae bacterium]
MIEKKLQNAAGALPENHSDFSAVEIRIQEKSRRPRPLRRKRLAIAMMLVVLLAGCMSVTVPEYHLYNGNWWSFIPGLHFDPTDEFGLHDNQTMKAAKSLDITLPETLGGHPIIDFDRNNLTTREVPLWYAWIWPDYLYFSSLYGYTAKVPLVMPDGAEELCNVELGADLTYGPTDNEVWRRQFGFDEKDVYTAGDYTLANHPVVEITSQEYEGLTIYTAQIGITLQDLPRWSVTWVDWDNGVVFSMDGYYETPDAMIGYAKEIIDLNR